MRAGGPGVEARTAVEPEATKVLRQARSAVKAILGKTSTALETYGIPAEKQPAALPPEKALAKAAKAKATRAARHTMGKNQKKAIKGQVPPPPAPPANPPPKPGP